MEVGPVLRFVPLVAVTAVGADLAGGKARVLGRLVSRGIDVPDGVVLLRPPAWQRAPGARRPMPGRTRPSGPSDAAVDEVARRLCGHFGGATLVVRRSPLREAVSATGGGAVRVAHGPRELADAMRLARQPMCHVTAGRCQHGERPPCDDEPIPVLVQRFVAAECSGVARPIADAADDALLVIARPEPTTSSMPGDGVDRWTVCHGVATPRSVTGQALTRDQVQAVAALATTVRSVVGGRPELEWAMAEHRLWVLRCRPAVPR